MASLKDEYRPTMDVMPSRSELIDEMIAKTPGWRGETLARLREVIHIADPDIVEDVKWRRPANPIGSAVFEHNGIVCVVAILKERVRLGLWDGASLPDIVVHPLGQTRLHQPHDMLISAVGRLP
jgi:hypothetical protein